jgi:transcriptional regulator with XRE-family HTH domain
MTTPSPTQIRASCVGRDYTQDNHYCVNVSIESQSVLGKNIARFRRAAKLSGEELAARAGSGLTRSIIANLENGRKGDVTTTQLLAISVALSINPGELLFALDDPYQVVTVTEYNAIPVTAPTWVAYGWFTGAFIPVEMTGATEHSRPPSSWNSESKQHVFHRIQERFHLLQKEATLATEAASLDREDWSPDSAKAAQIDRELTETRARLYALERNLRAEGVNLDREPNGPGLPF